MKNSTNIRISTVLLILLVLFTSGCVEKDAISTDPSIEGYVFDIKEDRVLVAYDITTEKYNQIRDKKLEDLSVSDAYVPLISLSYEKTSRLNKGDQVDVWIDGGVEDSYPQQASAKKIEVKD
ncbi:DUF3221 domain-containing protein [Radiobacillus sp. PE A8.2]|uniref:DUF3221 domain-containing protein n=1 Tax=Radiobacillus sp. PE A8.2 TaxID=3380349 RepID=UPI00388F0D98